jgi:very-short-patch-repair endonuclease
LLNTKQGYRLLNVIITRAKHKVFVFSSIPEDYFSKFTSDIIEKGNRGKGILYAYLSYCQAIENQDEAAIKNILGLVTDACDEEGLLRHNLQNEQSFTNEIYNYISDHIQEDYILANYQLGDYQIDFVLLDENQKPTIAIECDGALWHNSPQAYAYDLHRQRILENQGLKVFRTWAMAWWPKPQKEIDKLLAFVQEHCPAILNK